MWSCICLSKDCKHAVRISTLVQCAALRGDGRWTLIGLLHVTPRTHLRVSAQPFLDLRQAQSSFILSHNSNSAIEAPTSYFCFALHVCV